ncbi:hypothetical protein [Paenibacillus turpanensis]|uniref:hypothetical protein n=1 Tax=Paenibacillus turpanensis TaxID=2689078 RepID=UPI00140C1739|nr:hypothetical protein [Paenibacillus turpanensis]
MNEQKPENAKREQEIKSLTPEDRLQMTSISEIAEEVVKDVSDEPERQRSK